MEVGQKVARRRCAPRSPPGRKKLASYAPLGRVPRL